MENKKEQIKQQIKQKIEESDMVLIGIGELCAVRTKEMENHSPYAEILSDITKSDKMEELLWALETAYIWENKDVLIQFYNQIEQMIHGKNYFIVTTNADDVIYESNFNQERIVAPCGSISQFVCPQCEDKVIYNLSLDMKERNCQIILNKGNINNIQYMTCEKCGTKSTPNLYGNKKYVEEGYLEKWNLYMKWLQGSMNRKVCMLEMGVGMEFPSVIRWPFEKMAYYNQKSFLYRIHDKFFQLAEGTGERAMSIPENPLTIW